MKKYLLLILLFFTTLNLFSHDKGHDEEFSNHAFLNIAFGKLETELTDAISGQFTLGIQIAPFLAVTASYYVELHLSEDISDYEIGFNVDEGKDLLDIVDNSVNNRRSRALFISLEINNFIKLPLIDPYIGIGVGSQNITTQMEGIVTEEEEQISVYQAYLGVRIFLGDNLALFGEYRYIVREEEYNDSSILDDIEKDEKTYLLGLHFNI